MRPSGTSDPRTTGSRRRPSDYVILSRPMFKGFRGGWLGSTRDPLRAALGRLERAVMDTVWAGGDFSVRDVQSTLGRPAAYTTVMTTLDRLFKKGLVRRRREGPRVRLHRGARTARDRGDDDRRACSTACSRAVRARRGRSCRTWSTPSATRRRAARRARAARPRQARDAEARYARERRTGVRLAVSSVVLGPLLVRGREHRRHVRGLDALSRANGTRHV